MAVNDIILELAGIPGEAKDSKLPNSIQVEDFSLSARSPRDIATGAPTGKRHWTPLTVVKRVDAASALLVKWLTTNAKIGKGTLSVRRASGPSVAQQVYYKIEFEDLYVTSYTVGAPRDDGLAQETVELAWGKITVNYTGQTSLGMQAGNIVAGDDLRTLG